MSLDKIKNLIKKKSKNIITDQKANFILSVIKEKFPTSSLEDAISSIDKFTELPVWLNDALTINETFFFRHPQHFKSLETFFQNFDSKKVCSILCAGVSSGEEAYSISMLAHKHISNVNIQGIDLSQKSIETAKLAEYHESLVNRVSPEYKNLVFDSLTALAGDKQGYYQVKQNIKASCRFSYGNIFTLPLQNYDVIFVRNILIYFDESDKVNLVQKLKSKLKSGGLLFIGGGEILPADINGLSQENSTSIFKKVA